MIYMPSCTCSPRHNIGLNNHVIGRRQTHVVHLQAIKDVIGPQEDIPAPDMNTDGRVMSWFFDEYTKFEGFSPAVVTGKVHVHHPCLALHHCHLFCLLSRRSAAHTVADACCVFCLRRSLQAFAQGTMRSNHGLQHFSIKTLHTTGIAASHQMSCASTDMYVHGVCSQCSCMGLWGVKQRQGGVQSLPPENY